jgi:hypothetical protein
MSEIVSGEIVARDLTGLDDEFTVTAVEVSGGTIRVRGYVPHSVPVGEDLTGSQSSPAGIDLRLKRALIELQHTPVQVMVPYGVASEWDLGEL